MHHCSDAFPTLSNLAVRGVMDSMIMLVEDRLWNVDRDDLFGLLQVPFLAVPHALKNVHFCLVIQQASISSRQDSVPKILEALTWLICSS